MKIDELKNKKIVIWGLGREAKAAAQMIRTHLPTQKIIFVDESAKPDLSIVSTNDQLLINTADIKKAVFDADVVIKSPGVSLYHPCLQNIKAPITSLLNLWLAQPHRFKTIGITGTKGKSTTSSLLAYTLKALGKNPMLVGNIGVPVTETTQAIDFAIVEVSSYQAATLSEYFDIGVVTALYPEHLDWHKTLTAYYRDKLNLLSKSHVKIISDQAKTIAQENALGVPSSIVFNDTQSIHVQKGHIFDGAQDCGIPDNAYLSRAHNLINVCAVLTLIKQLGLDAQEALRAMRGFEGLPHRQQEIGKKNGILFVDDSISTTPQSAIAAMNTYKGHPLTLLAGGFDRGIDYAPLVDYIFSEKIHAVYCMGPSGERIFASLHERGAKNVFKAATLQEAVAQACQLTPQNGVILLSPAAPSYGMFKDFEERGQKFAAYADLPAHKDNA